MRDEEKEIVEAHMIVQYHLFLHQLIGLQVQAPQVAVVGIQVLHLILEVLEVEVLQEIGRLKNNTYICIINFKTNKK
jgi:hypothetical protein